MTPNTNDHAHDDRITPAIDRLAPINAIAETTTKATPPAATAITRKPRRRRRPGPLVCPHCCESSLWPAGYHSEACCPHCQHKFPVADQRLGLESDDHFDGPTSAVGGAAILLLILIIFGAMMWGFFALIDEQDRLSKSDAVGQNGGR
jgi:hypothetical protein